MTPFLIRFELHGRVVVISGRMQIVISEPEPPAEIRSRVTEEIEERVTEDGEMRVA